MERKQIKALIAAASKEGTDVSEIVDQILEINGNDIENAKKKSGVVELEEKAASLQSQLDSYTKEDGEHYIDPKEFERLKNFEVETKAAQKKQSVGDAVKEMLTRHKVKPDMVKLIIKGLNVDDVKIGEDGKVAKDYESSYMESFKKEYPDSFETPTPGTGNPARNPEGGNPKGVPQRKQNLSEILQEIKN